jgi:hypothetical protein
VGSNKKKVKVFQNLSLMSTNFLNAASTSLLALDFNYSNGFLIVSMGYG